MILIIICLINLVSCSASIPKEILDWGINLETIFRDSADGTDFNTNISKLIDPEKPELITEFVRRMQDIKRNGGSQYEINIVSFKDYKNKTFIEQGIGLLKNEYMAKINESYFINSKIHNSSFWAKFVINQGRAYYSDVEFCTKTDGNDKLYFAPEIKDLAPIILEESKLAYTKATEHFNGSIYNVCLKVYSNSNIFKEFIKPSIQFDMSGWNEYGESIKINLSDLDYKFITKNLGDKEVVKKFREYLKKVLTHEMSHLITGEITGNNIPYWLSEGIAISTMNSLNSQNNNAILKPTVSLIELSNLNIENASEESVINSYYSDCELYVNTFIRTYGYKGLANVLNDLGEYPVNDENSSDSFILTNKILEEVIMKRYGIGTRKFGEKLIK